MAKCRIILADDHKILREGLKGLLEKEDSFEIVAQAQDGQDLLTQLKKNKCDVVITDLSMPNMDGMSAIKAIREKYSKIKILVLTMLKDQEHFKHVMSAGAAGYILKEDAFDQLIMAIKLVVKGKQFVSPAISHSLTEQYVRSLDQGDEPLIEILTRREQQILKFIASGLANKNVANKLKISVRTVETHRANLSKKLGIHNTANLVKYAISKNLV